MTPQQQYEQAWAYVTALAGDPNVAVMDWRALHSTDKSDPGHAHRGTLPECWQWISGWNAAGWCLFVTPSAMDGQGRKLDNVACIRAQYVDLDNAAAPANLDRAAASVPAPSFAVQSSPGKAHVYWPVDGYSGNDRFTALQRRLRQQWDGDPAVIDATRVMRLPGTTNWKYGAPGHYVTMQALAGWGQRVSVETLEQAYAHVQVIEGSSGSRHDLGDPSLAAPSLEWVKYALAQIDPNQLTRGEWISTLAATKQAAWSLATPEQVEQMLMEWCARYEKNDPAENRKQIASIRQTEVGWANLSHRAPGVRAAMAFGGQQTQTAPAPVPAPVSEGDAQVLGEILTAQEQTEWFKGCVSVTSMGKIFGPDGRFHDQKAFNLKYGGKIFIITSEGKSTDEPWKAATRSTLWRVPMVDHIRFLPDQEPGMIVTDALGRKGLNTYVKPVIRTEHGDVAPFLDHMTRIIPDEGDRNILYDWMAHTTKFPGFKIPWAPVIQSAEGIGKGVIKELMTYAVGLPYVHFPDAQQLGDSGGKFNGWMRNKIFILADEIKVGDKIHMVEVLKPLISERLIEVQSKGVDQIMEDNCANWGFFTNYKDAIPMSRNGRRYAVFYSPLQTEEDILALGMGNGYFNHLFAWLRADGAAYMTQWLMDRPIACGDIPMRAPKTTSHDEAVRIGRSPIERCITEAVAAGLPGFRGGWISMVSLAKRIKDEQVTRGAVPPHVIQGLLESMGYVLSGRALRPYIQEDKDRLSELFHLGGAGDVGEYGRVQGWE